MMTMISKQISILLYVLFPVFAFSQTRVVTGHVKDETGKAVSGASIQALPSGKGTVSRGNGEFVLTVNEKDRSLIVSAANYETDSTQLGAANEYEIKLRAASVNLADENYDPMCPGPNDPGEQLVGKLPEQQRCEL